MIYSLEDLKEYLAADYEKQAMTHPMFARLFYGENWAMYSYVKNLRYLEYYKNSKRTLWNRIAYVYHLWVHRRNCIKYQINVSPNTCGKGLFLQHPGFRRIGAYMHIGENCTILPMVLIGKKASRVNTENSCIIGDNCYIGTGAIIMEPISIGNNVTIAAGSVVTHDIPDNAVVAGNPAKIIKMKS